MMPNASKPIDAFHYREIAFASSSSSSNSPPSSQKRPPLLRKRSVEFCEQTCLLSSPVKSPKHRIPHIQLYTPYASSSPFKSSDCVPECSAPAVIRTRSILKPTSHPINLARTLVEGTKYNSGPRRHSTTLIDLDERMTPQAVAAALGPHSTFKEATSSAVDTLRNSVFSTECTPRISKVVFDDLVHHKAQDAKQHLMFGAATTRNTLSLRDVEKAYALFEHRARAWATRTMRSLSPEQSVFPYDALALSEIISDDDVCQTVQESVCLVARCIERDISALLDNVTQAQYHASNARSHASALMQPASISPPLPANTAFGGNQNKENLFPAFSARKHGKSEGEVQYTRLRCDVAQSSLKCLGTLLHFPCYSKAMPQTQVLQLMRLVLRIPMTAYFREPKDKEVVAFAMWILSVQRLSTAIIDELKKPITLSLQSVFDPSGNFAQRNSDKAKKSLSEALSACTTLSKHFTNIFVPVLFGMYMPESRLFCNILDCSMAPALQTRLRALSAIGAIIDGTRFSSSWQDQTPEGLQYLADLANSMGAFALEYFTRFENGSRQRYLWDLLEKAVVKDEDFPWAVNYVAMLPALLGRRFRRMETDGPQNYMRFMGAFLTHNNKDLAGFAHLSWRHLVYAWMSNCKAPASPEQLVWALEQKPRNLLHQLLTPEANSAKAIANQSLGPDSPTYTCQAALNAIFGYTVLLQSLQLPAKAININFSTLWTEVIDPSCHMLLASANAADQTILYHLLIKLFTSISTQSARLERLISPTITSGKLGAQTTPASLHALHAVELASSISLKDVQPLPESWISMHRGKILSTFLACFERSLQSVDSQVHTEGDKRPACPEDLSRAWSAFCSNLTTNVSSNSHEDADQLHTWLVDMSCQSQIETWANWSGQLARAVSQRAPEAFEFGELLKYNHLHTALRSKLILFNQQVTFARQDLEFVSETLYGYLDVALSKHFAPRDTALLKTIAAWLMRLINFLRIAPADFTPTDLIDTISATIIHALVKLTEFLVDQPHILQDVYGPVLHDIVLTAQDADTAMSLQRKMIGVSTTRSWQNSHFGLLFASCSQHEIIPAPTWQWLTAFSSECLRAEDTHAVRALFDKFLQWLDNVADRIRKQAVLQAADLFLPWLNSASIEQADGQYLLLIYCSLLQLAARIYQDARPRFEELRDWQNLLVCCWTREAANLEAAAQLSTFWSATFEGVVKPKQVPLQIQTALALTNEAFSQELLNDLEADTCLLALHDKHPIELDAAPESDDSAIEMDMDVDLVESLSQDNPAEMQPSTGMAESQSSQAVRVVDIQQPSSEADLEASSSSDSPSQTLSLRPSHLPTASAQRRNRKRRYSGDEEESVTTGVVLHVLSPSATSPSPTARKRRQRRKSIARKEAQTIDCVLVDSQHDLRQFASSSPPKADARALKRSRSENDALPLPQSSVNLTINIKDKVSHKTIRRIEKAVHASLIVRAPTIISV